MLSRAKKQVRPVKPAAPEEHVEHPVCHDLKAWAESASDTGADYRVLEPARVIERPPPKTVEPQVDPSFERLCSFPLPERVLVKVPNAGIVGIPEKVKLKKGGLAGIEPGTLHALFRPKDLAKIA
jgi:hypothetical protein